MKQADMADSTSVVRRRRAGKPVHYTLQIKSFSSLKAALTTSNRDRYESQIFDVGGYKWKLALYPNGDEKRNGKNHISMYLVTVEDDILTTTLEVNVLFTLLVYDSLQDEYLAVHDGKTRCFHAMKTQWGFEKLVSLETFNDSSNGFLVDDYCAFGVDIFIMKFDGKGEILSFINQPKNYKFTWKLKDFSQLHQTCYESDAFTVENYRWKISLYPKGCSTASSGYVSLYLTFDSFKELPQGSQVYIEYDMAILTQLWMEPKIKRSYKCWFEFGDVKTDWGTSNFIRLSDLKEPKKGTFHNDSMIVEVSINVISTLKKFL